MPKTVIRINSVANKKSTEEYEEVNPEICDVCGHELFEDDDFCPHCGADIEKELRPKKQAKTSTGGGGIILIILVAIIVIWLLAKK